MPILLKTIEDLLYEKRRDIFVLRLYNQGSGIAFRSENQDNAAIEKEQLDWLNEHGVHYEKTVSQCIIEGWIGQYYVDFNGWDDPIVAEYTKAFENENGVSNHPTKYQMHSRSYQQFVDSGDHGHYKQYLIDRSDPNYMI